MSKISFCSNKTIGNKSKKEMLAFIKLHLEERESREHKNDLIEKDRTYLNETYINPNPFTPTEEQIKANKKARVLQANTKIYTEFCSTLTLIDTTGHDHKWIANHSWNRVYSKPKEQEKLKQDIAQWYNLKLQMLKERFGDRLVRVDLHMDETNPHIHAVIINWDCKTERFNTSHTWNSGTLNNDFDFMSKANFEVDKKFCDEIETNFKYDLLNRDGRITPVNKKKQDLADLKANGKAFLTDAETIDRVNKSKYVQELKKRTETKKNELAVVRSEVESLKNEIDRLKGIKAAVDKWADPNYVKKEVNEKFDISVQQIVNENKEFKSANLKFKNENNILEEDLSILEKDINDFLKTKLDIDTLEEFEQFRARRAWEEANKIKHQDKTGQAQNSSEQKRGGQGGQ